MNDTLLTVGLKFSTKRNKSKTDQMATGYSICDVNDKRFFAGPEVEGAMFWS